MTTAPAPAVVRDRTTWLAYIQIGLFGYFLYAFTPTVALLRDEHGYTRPVASLHGAAMAVGTVIAGLSAAAIVRRIGRGPMLRLGSALLVAGVLVYVGSYPLWLTVAGAGLAGAGGTLMLAGINAFLPDHHGAAAPRAMSEGHAFGAVMGLLGPLAIGVGVALGWGWRPGLLAAAVAMVGLEIARGSHLEPFDGPHGHPDDEPGHAPRGPMPRTVWIALLVFGMAASTEFSLTFWGSDLLREQAGLGDAAAAAALVTIVGGLAVGRVAGAPLVSRFDPDVVLMATFALTIVGFGAAWLSAEAVPMLVALTITGVALGLQSPLAIGRAVIASQGQADRAAGYSSVAAGLASGLAPFALAALADAVGVHTAFLLVPAFMVAAIVLVQAARVPRGSSL